MKALLLALASATAVAITLSLAGCDEAVAAGSSNPPLGRPCTIQFRRDALGAASNVPVSPMTGNYNGADTAISGTLKSVGGEWVVLEADREETWVPKAVILLIQVH